MKKIIFACDGKSFPKGAFELIKEMYKTEPALITGTFLHAINFEEFLPGAFSLSAGPSKEFFEEEQREFRSMVRQFEEQCQKNGLEYRVHEESMNWNIDNLVKETRFADLMVMSAELFCDDLNTRQPNSFMQQAIHKSECPVICVPESFLSIKKIVFAYDGKKESMFALKQFCNLFPQLSALPTKIVYAKDEASVEIPDLIYLEEYAGRHFKNLDIEKVPFNGKKYFESWAKDDNNTILVSGAFGRSGLSTAFKRSFVEDVIHQHLIPVFIAHH